VHTFDEMAAQIDGVYSSLATRLGARLAPVGRAFVAAVANDPSLELYRSDSSHPTPAGSFLAACVLYGALTGQDPRASSYVPFGSNAVEAERIKTLAANVLGEPATPPAPPSPAAEPPPPAPAAEAVAVSPIDPLAPVAPPDASAEVASEPAPELLESLPPAPAPPEPAPMAIDDTSSPAPRGGAGVSSEPASP
jgi:hypothetical protein